MFLNGVYLKSRSVRRFFLFAKPYICQPAFHMTKLDLKRILRRSIIRCRSATLSPTAKVKSKAMPARRDYCNTDSPHVNIDSVRAEADFRGFFEPFWPFLGHFLRRKLPNIGEELDRRGFRAGTENSLVDIN